MEGVVAVSILLVGPVVVVSILRIKEGKGFFMLELEVEKRRRNRPRVVFVGKEVVAIARREGRKISTTLELTLYQMWYSLGFFDKV